LFDGTEFGATPVAGEPHPENASGAQRLDHIGRQSPRLFDLLGSVAQHRGKDLSTTENLGGVTGRGRRVAATNIPQPNRCHHPSLLTGFEVPITDQFRPLGKHSSHRTNWQKPLAAKENQTRTNPPSFWNLGNSVRDSGTSFPRSRPGGPARAEFKN
jgi:hypothetical protein